MSASRSFVLLCAEEDDLALVQWVHAARERGLAPEIVTGVERDDAPLLDALADVDCALFVVLRSEHLDAARMRAIKTAFGRHRRPEQRLFALRLDTGAAVAIDRVAAELGGGSRARSEISMVISIDDLLGPDAPAVVPSVDRALHLGARALECEVTSQFEVGDETIPMLAAAVREPVAAPRRTDRSRFAAWIGALGIAGAAAGAAMTLGPSAEVRTTAALEPAPLAPAAIAAPVEHDTTREPDAPREPDTTREHDITREHDATHEPTTVQTTVDEAPVVIRVPTEPTTDAVDDVEAPVEAPRSAAPRHRPGRRPATAREPVAMATPVAAIEPATAPAAVSMVEPKAPVGDTLPIEPAPLEAPPAIAATPAAPPTPDDAPSTPTPAPAP